MDILEYLKTLPQPSTDCPAQQPHFEEALETFSEAESRHFMVSGYTIPSHERELVRSVTQEGFEEPEAVCEGLYD